MFGFQEVKNQGCPLFICFPISTRALHRNEEPHSFVSLQQLNGNPFEEYTKESLNAAKSHVYWEHVTPRNAHPIG